MRSLAESLGNPLDIEAYIRSEWHMLDDPLDAEYIRTPQYQLRRLRLEGDCDDAATLAASLLYALNIPCRFVAISMPSDCGDFSHVFTRCNMGAGFVLDIDPIVPLDRLPIRGAIYTMEVPL